MTALNPVDAEQLTLCAAMADVGAWRTVTQSLAVRDFADPRHQTIYAALLTSPQVGRSTDLEPTLRAIREDDALREYAGWLMDLALSFDALPNWVATIAEASLARRTAAALAAAARAVEAGEPRERAEHALEQKLAAIRASAPDHRVFDDKRIMADAAVAYLTDDAALRAGTPYGFVKWDDAVLPAMPGHLVLLGGASGSGKSTVARNLIRAWTHRYGRTVGWLTCEMTGEEQLVHLACIDAGITIEDYYRRALSSAQVEAFRECIAYWRDTDRLRINEMGAVTPERMLSIFRRWREQGVTHFVVDHLHRLDYGARKSGDDLRVPVADCARTLKNFAKDSEAIVCALVQYSKIKSHDEPGDEKIREANNILEESDAVFHIYRPLVACERDTHGVAHPLVKGDAGRYFEGDVPHGAYLAPDAEYVYIKLGKQRRRLRDGLVRVPFNHRLAVMYDTLRVETGRLSA